MESWTALQDTLFIAFPAVRYTILLIGMFFLFSGCDSEALSSADQRDDTEMEDDRTPVDSVEVDPRTITENWTEFVVDTLMTFRGPTSLQGGPLQGIDSQVGRYQDSTLFVSYDWGHFTLPQEECDASYETCRMEQADLGTLTGRLFHGFVRFFDGTLVYMSSVDVDSVDIHRSRLSFWAFSESPQDSVILQGLTRSLRLQD